MTPAQRKLATELIDKQAKEIQKKIDREEFVTDLRRIQCKLDLQSNGRELIKSLIKKYEQTRS